MDIYDQRIDGIIKKSIVILRKELKEETIIRKDKTTISITNDDLDDLYYIEYDIFKNKTNIETKGLLSSLSIDRISKILNEMYSVLFNVSNEE